MLLITLISNAEAYRLHRYITNIDLGVIVATICDWMPMSLLGILPGQVTMDNHKVAMIKGG